MRRQETRWQIKTNQTQRKLNGMSRLPWGKKPVQLGREPSKKCILNYTALNES